MKKQSNKMLILIFSITLVIMVILIANVFLVSVGKYHLRSGTDLHDYVNKANVQTEVIKATRGYIYDASGNVIAQDNQTYNIVCILSKDRPAVEGSIAYVDDKEYTAKVLSSLLDITYDKCFEFLSQDVYQTELGTAGRNLSKSTKETIESYDLPGIEFTSSIERSYPLGIFASNLIGFAQSDESGSTIGQMGLELYLDDYLRGKDGSKTYQADKNGYILPGMLEDVEEAVNGANVYLTIDKEIQETLETAFDETNSIFNADRIWGAVMEIDTGKILAWGQSPSFDPNTLEIEDYNNYGSQIPYEPGSTMKSFVYAAAINEGVYDGSAKVYGGPYCYSSYGTDPVRVEEGTGYGCIYNSGMKNYGMIDYDYGLIYSANTITASVETDLITPDIYLDYLNKFGFFQAVETDGMQEQTGYLNFTWPYDKLALCYGQGSTVTMLQMLQAYSAIFGDGTMKKPYVIDRIVDSYDSNNVLYQGETEITGEPISEESAKEVQRILYRVVNDDDGTARYYRIPECEIIGKTGTTQVAKSGTYNSGKTIVSFMCALPADDPQYMVYYCFEADYNRDAHYYSEPIKTVIRKVAMRYGLSANTTEQVTDENGEETESYEIKTQDMINVTNHTLTYALDKLNEYHADIYVLGEGDTVIDQSPKENSSLTTNQKVFLLTDTANIEMPDMTGWSVKEVTAFWNITGFGFKIEGTGNVVSQNIPAGTFISKDEEIEVVLE